jgi:hypothetical protein
MRIFGSGSGKICPTGDAVSPAYEPPGALSSCPPSRGAGALAADEIKSQLLGKWILPERPYRASRAASLLCRKPPFHGDAKPLI